MSWTTTPPTEPGWYWLRDRRFPKDIDPMQIGERLPKENGITEWWPIPIEEPKP